MDNSTNNAMETSVPKESQNVNLVQSIIKFDYNAYNEEEDADYQPDPEVEEEIIQEYQTEAEKLIADKVYHEFVDNLNASQNIDNLEDTADDNDFIAELDDSQNKQDEKQEENEDNAIDCDSAAYDSTCTETELETDLEDENVKTQIDGEELNHLCQQIPVKVPISSLHANQTAYPPFWRVKHALQNVDSEQEADVETDPDYNPLPKDADNGLDASKQEDPQAEMGARSLQLRHRTVQVKGNASNDTSDSSSESEEDEEDEEDDEELKTEIDKLKELEDLSSQVKGMVEMVEEMSFVDGSQDDHNNSKNFCGFRFVNTEESQKILGMSKHFQNSNIQQVVSIVDAIAKFDDQTYQEEEDADYSPNENKENEICMQEC